MAIVSLPSGVDEVVTDPVLLDYYRGEGYPVVEDAPEITLPRVFDGEQYVGEAPVEPPVVKDGDEFAAGVPDDGTHGEVPDADMSGQIEQLPEGQFVEADPAEKTHPGTGVVSEGVEAPADGTPVEIGNDSAPSETNTDDGSDTPKPRRR